MIANIKFVSIPTHDQERAVEFWTKQVGFQVYTDQPFDDNQRWIELRIGSSETHLVVFRFDEQGLQPGMMFNGAFASTNVNKTYKELVERGVEFVSEPKEEPWGTFAVFKDLDGNQFVLSSR